VPFEPSLLAQGPVDVDVPWWLSVGLLAGFTLLATLNLGLRIPSRARMAAEFERRECAHRFNLFVLRRSQYMLATAVGRSVLMVVLFLIGLSYGRVRSVSLADAQTVFVCLATLGMYLIFGVAIPTSWSRYHGDSLVVGFLPLLNGLRLVFYPVVVVLAAFDPIVRRLAGIPPRDERSYADELEQEILSVVTEGELHGAVDIHEKEMIESVMELGDTRVSKIMTPRTQIVAMSVEADRDAILDLIRKRGHSRIPVYEHSVDTILGILYAKDLLFLSPEEPFKLQAIIRRALFIPETKLVRELLREFQERKVHMAIVLDEYGGTSGLVTIEDILEELVGEIVDEYDRSAPQELQRIDDRTFELAGRMKIHDVNERLGLELPEDRDFETIAGFVFSKLGKIPAVGEQFEQDGLRFRITAADPRRVTRMRLLLPTPEGSATTPVNGP